VRGDGSNGSRGGDSAAGAPFNGSIVEAGERLVEQDEARMVRAVQSDAAACRKSRT
jgi:hypothetical protein